MKKIRLIVFLLCVFSQGSFFFNAGGKCVNKDYSGMLLFLFLGFIFSFWFFYGGFLSVSESKGEKDEKQG